MRFLVSLLLLAVLAACADAPDPGDESFDEAMAREHDGDRPTPTALGAAPAADDVVAEPVVYATVGGSSVTGYLARPADEAVDGDSTRPGIVVIHEWWGLNDNIRGLAERLAVDLYGGDVADTPDRARALMQTAMGREEALTDNLTQAVEYLQLQRDAARVGVIGWCLGGGWSLKTALAAPEQIDAAVIYYGQLITDPDRLDALDMPILGIFGAEDSGIPVQTVRQFGSTLDSLGVDATIEVYEGAGHAFANPSGERYVPSAAEDAWAKTLAFFERTLGE